ncbi:hypothetical protein ACIA47_11280 [Micromonospora sp. NPDC051227]|uniref:hypothetical protein n=1 Tax=Micromonospora sp. NPDC051227 TaxID=3364285 RepID=UPI0037AA3FA0
MQEQPPSESTRREPAERARRRSPRATFRPPIVAEEPAEVVEPEASAPPAATPATQRPRRAKAAPAVLFQPPEPDRPLPRQPRRASAELTTDTSAEQPEHAEQPTGDQPSPATGLASTPPKARTAPVRRAASRQAADTPAEVTPATPAPRKRAAKPTKAASTSEAQSTTAANTTGEASTITPTAPAKAAKTTKRAATPRKSTTPTRSTPPTEPAPAERQVPPAAPVVQQAEPALPRTPESELRAVAARVLDHPGFAPELLALAAVRAFGPGAAGWAAGLRARYPDASADGLARLAARRFVRSAGAGGATAALAGFFAPLAELAAVLWTHSELVLHLAAAYGEDPTHPDRAVDLLVLTQVHPDRASAAAALAAAEAAGDPIEGAWPRAAEAAWRLAAPLTAQAGGWVALRLVARLLPGAAVLAAALGDSAAADRLAARAVAVYRPDRR